LFCIKLKKRVTINHCVLAVVLDGANDVFHSDLSIAFSDEESIYLSS